MRLTRLIRPKKRSRKSNRLSEYRTTKCLIISLDGEDDCFSDFVHHTFLPQMLNISPKECQDNEFDVMFQFKKFVFWRGPSIKSSPHSAFNQYLLFHRCDLIFFTISKINQQVDITKFVFVEMRDFKHF